MRDRAAGRGGERGGALALAEAAMPGAGGSGIAAARGGVLRPPRERVSWFG
ncbi:MAG: hypothetical protein ACREE5_10170 [Acetobacteraceae bacterium]